MLYKVVILDYTKSYNTVTNLCQRKLAIRNLLFITFTVEAQKRKRVQVYILIGKE